MFVCVLVLRKGVFMLGRLSLSLSLSLSLCLLSFLLDILPFTSLPLIHQAEW